MNKYIQITMDSGDKQSDIGCLCSETESCPICKDEKIAAGQGAKFDRGKLQYSLIPPIATASLAEVLTFGATKYAPNS